VYYDRPIQPALHSSAPLTLCATIPVAQNIEKAWYVTLYSDSSCKTDSMEAYKRPVANVHSLIRATRIGVDVFV